MGAKYGAQSRRSDSVTGGSRARRRSAPVQDLSQALPRPGSNWGQGEAVQRVRRDALHVVRAAGERAPGRLTSSCGDANYWRALAGGATSHEQCVRVASVTMRVRSLTCVPPSAGGAAELETLQ